MIVQPDDLKEFASPENLLPKEKELIKIVNKEMSEGRNLFIYTEYSGSEETDIDARLQAIVEKHCNLKGQVKVLKSKEVKPANREEFIKKNSEKYKIFITNYRNVETGIDFVGEYEGRKYNYPTLVFYQTGMSLFSVSQAARRHYRINQTEECRTYYLVYNNTFQLDMLEMMSKKMSAASAIQGNFSESALENMAGAEDPAVVLAKKILQGQTGSSDSADVEAQMAATRRASVDACDESRYVGPEPVTYYDIMGKEGDLLLTGLFAGGNAGENLLFEQLNETADSSDEKAVEEKSAEEQVSEGIDTVNEIMSLFAELGLSAEANFVTVGQTKKTKKSQRQCFGQGSLFSFTDFAA
jgi:hypothetical protein